MQLFWKQSGHLQSNYILYSYIRFLRIEIIWDMFSDENTIVIEINNKKTAKRPMCLEI